MSKHAITPQQRFVKRFIESFPDGYSKIIFELERDRQWMERHFSKASLWSIINLQKKIPFELALRLHRSFPKRLPLKKLIQRVL